ncbi:MAG: alkaline phosphatase family protein [Gemmatimonadetes bacterium]|nr:alkaline phosphatase family protein [Gemmatimonadota bacterium]
MDGSKVLILGVDGGSYELIRRWAGEGLLPAFRELLATGASGILESTHPPVTSPAWPCFMTGKNPAKHGVFDFITHDGSDVGLVSSRSVESKTLWELLSEKGKRVGVVDIPVTHPPRPVNGFVISDALLAGRPASWPADFLARCEEKLGPYQIFAQTPEADLVGFAEETIGLLGRMETYLHHFLDEEQPDFLAVRLGAPDAIQHFYWRYMDRDHPLHDPAEAERLGGMILKAYAKVDEILGRVLARLGDEWTVMIVSDHGFGPLLASVNLNMFLLAEGLLHLKRDPVTRLKHALFRRGFSPSRVYRAVSRLGGEFLAKKVGRKARNKVIGKFLSFDDVDWSRTRAFSMGHMGQIYVNVKGREPKGIVDRGPAYEEVRNEVERALRKLVNPRTGGALVDRVIRREEVYAGPYVDAAPDLLVVMDDFRYIAFPLFASEAAVITSNIRQNVSGSHRMEGILAVRGPQVARGRTVTGARLVDVAPTVLHLMGLPVPDDMDGRVLRELFAGAGDASRDVKFEAGRGAFAQEDGFELGAEEEEEVEERLRQLGYLG